MKYRADLREGWAIFRPAFAAAREWFGCQGARFRIVTESAIRIPKLTNAKRLLPLAHDAVPADDERLIFGALADGTAKPFSVVANTATSPEFPREKVLAAMWTLLAKRKLMADFDEVIVGRSPVWPAWAEKAK